MKPLIFVAMIAGLDTAQAQTVRPVAWTLASIPWQSRAANGTRYALLEGSRDAPDRSFTYAFFIPAGVWDSPHWHSTTARIFVAKGALGIGTETPSTSRRPLVIRRAAM